MILRVHFSHLSIRPCINNNRGVPDNCISSSRHQEINFFFFKFKNIVMSFIKISQFENCQRSQTKTSPVTYTRSWTHTYNHCCRASTPIRARRSQSKCAKKTGVQLCLEYILSSPAVRNDIKTIAFARRHITVC